MNNHSSALGGNSRAIGEFPGQKAAFLSGLFPVDFIWGAATSAFQIEGSWDSHGKGPSIWDEFCRHPGNIADGSNGNIACNHYHRLNSDLNLIARLGLDAYRFSISWPRVQPSGEGKLNEQGMEFYDRLINGLLERGVRPFVTLYHWDLPQALQIKYGGWQSRETAYRFMEYAAAMAQRFGDRAVAFATHNEPWVTAVLGHEQGIFAPGIKNPAVAIQVSHHLLLSHGLATTAIRESGTSAEVGMVLNLSPTFPLTNSRADIARARLEDGLSLRWYMDALCKKEYPEDVLTHPGRDAPDVHPGDMEIIGQPIDFIGVNYYTRSVVSDAAPVSPESRGVPVTDMGWEIYPAGLTELLLRLNREYTLPKIYITENGAAFQDVVTDNKVEDEDRRQYIESHITAVAAAIQAGVKVNGYFVWSLFDNFEWASGYQKRFGIVRVDYDTQTRTLKRSALWYRQFIGEIRYPIVIRGFQPDDSEAVRHITGVATQELRRVYVPNESNEAGNSPAPTFLKYVACDSEGDVQGIVEFIPQGDVLLIQGLAVHPVARKQGVAKALLSHLHAIACKSGLAAMELKTIAETVNSLVFERLGFTVVDSVDSERFSGKRGGKVVELTMRCGVSQSPVESFRH